MPDPSLPTPADTALQAILGSLARGALKIAGTALVTHGVMNAATANAMSPILAQELAGAALVALGQGWGVARAWFAHTRFAVAVAQLRAEGK